MKIGHEIWKMRVNHYTRPCVNYELNYTDYHENHNTPPHCVQIYTAFQPDLRYLECMAKN